MIFHLIIAGTYLISLAAAKPTVYLIRHGEKPADGNGLNVEGLQRAQCLRNVFSSSSQYHISHIMAQKPKKDGKQQRPYDTVEPLAKDLGLKVDILCERDDYDCVADVVNRYSGPGNILICWEHNALTGIVRQLGNKKAPQYPDESFNLIWTNPAPYRNISATTLEKCPGLDG